MPNHPTLTFENEWAVTAPSFPGANVVTAVGDPAGGSYSWSENPNNWFVLDAVSGVITVGDQPLTPSGGLNLQVTYTEDRKSVTGAYFLVVN